MALTEPQMAERFHYPFLRMPGILQEATDHCESKKANPTHAAEALQEKSKTKTNSTSFSEKLVYAREGKFQLAANLIHTSSLSIPR